MRVWIPFASSTIVLLLTVVGIAFFSPGSALVLLATSVIGRAGRAVAVADRVRPGGRDRPACRCAGELADSARELARTAADLVAYGAAGGPAGRFAAIDAKLRRAAARSAWIRGIGTAARCSQPGAAVIGALVIGGGQVAGGTLAPVMLAVLVLTPLALHEALSTLIASAQTRTRARAALDRVSEVLDAEAGRRRRPHRRRGAGVPDPSLEVRDLTAGWPGSAPVVAGLTFSVRAGEKVALVGPSGVGKTTVAATVLGLIPALAGRGRHARPDRLPGPGRPHLHHHDHGERAHRQPRRDRRRDRRRARPGRTRPRPGTGRSARPARPSPAARPAGWRWPRLLVGDYQVMILDEPTEHLDAATATALIDDIWAGSEHRPVLVITHDPALVARCDRLVPLGRAARPAPPRRPAARRVRGHGDRRVSASRTGTCGSDPCRERGRCRCRGRSGDGVRAGVGMVGFDSTLLLHENDCHEDLDERRIGVPTLARSAPVGRLLHRGAGSRHRRATRVKVRSRSTRSSSSPNGSAASRSASRTSHSPALSRTTWS